MYVLYILPSDQEEMRDGMGRTERASRKDNKYEEVKEMTTNNDAYD